MSLTKTRSLTYSALFLALALVLPFLTASIPQIGQALLPMHIPVLLCGFLCGWKYGGIVGFTAPLLRSLLFGMPPLFPIATAMAFELTAYGMMAGWISSLLPKKLPFAYVSLVVAMIFGRLIWGGAMMVLLAINHTPFPFAVFVSGTVVNAIPGILFQFILIPPIVHLWQVRKRGI